AIALKELRKFVERDEEAEAKLRGFALFLARPQFERLGWSVKDNEPESDTKLRSLIIGLMLYGEDPVVEAYCQDLYLKGVETIDSELRHLVIGAAVKRSEDDSIITSLLAQ